MSEHNRGAYGSAPAAAVRVNSVPENIDSSGSSGAAPSPSKTLRSSTSAAGVPTQTTPTLTALRPLSQDLSRRSDGASSSRAGSWFPTAVGADRQQPTLQQNNIQHDTTMTDNSTHFDLLQNIQNNIVVAMTSLDPQVVAEAWRVVEAARAEASLTKEAALLAIQQTQ